MSALFFNIHNNIHSFLRLTNLCTVSIPCGILGVNLSKLMSNHFLFGKDLVRPRFSVIFILRERFAAVKMMFSTFFKELFSSLVGVLSSK